MIGRERDLGEVRHEDQQQHRKGGDYELARYDEGNGDEPGLENRAADLVDDPGQDPLIDRAPLFDQRQNVRQASLRENNAGGALGAVLTAMPTSAWRKAGASLTPSPVMPVTCTADCSRWTTAYLSTG